MMEPIVITISFNPVDGSFGLSGPDMAEYRSLWDYMLAQTRRQLDKVCNEADEKSLIIKPTIVVAARGPHGKTQT